MPGCALVFGGSRMMIDFAGDYKPGDPKPTGFMDCFDWSEAQEKGGLRQTTCGVCGKWQYPQELSERLIESKGFVKRGGVKVACITEEPVCLECDKRAATATTEKR